MSERSGSSYPKAMESSLWIVAFIRPDGTITWINEIYSDVTIAIEEALAEQEKGEEIKLIQVILDKDMPSRWADKLMTHLENITDPEDPHMADALDALKDEVRDFTPTQVDELPTEGLTLTGPKKG